MTEEQSAQVAEYKALGWSFVNEDAEAGNDVHFLASLGGSPSVEKAGATLEELLSHIGSFEAQQPAHPYVAAR
jgi:hypothetical protein